MTEGEEKPAKGWTEKIGAAVEGKLLGWVAGLAVAVAAGVGSWLLGALDWLASGVIVAALGGATEAELAEERAAREALAAELAALEPRMAGEAVHQSLAAWVAERRRDIAPPRIALRDEVESEVNRLAGRVLLAPQLCQDSRLVRFCIGGRQCPEASGEIVRIRRGDPEGVFTVSESFVAAPDQIIWASAAKHAGIAVGADGSEAGTGRLGLDYRSNPALITLSYHAPAGAAEGDEQFLLHFIYVDADYDDVGPPCAEAEPG